MKLIIIIILILLLTILLKKKRESFSINNLKFSNKLLKENIKNLKKGQEIMTKIFGNFDKICKKYNLKYWCIGGTLIGTIRHKGWIPWDGDIDIGMLETDYQKFKNVIIKEKLIDMELSEPEKLKWKPCSKLRSNRAKYVYTEWGKNWDKDEGVQIDIFIFKKDKNYIYSNSPVCGEPDKTKRKIEDIFPLKKLHFENINVYVPNKYKIICKELWGNYPPKILDEEKRYPHEGNIIIKENDVSNTNDKYFKDILNSKEKKDLDIILSETLRHLKKKNINYFFAFGSLIGAVRHGFRMPFDDDIDLVINDKDLENFFSNLKIIKTEKNQKTYHLNNNVKIIHKNWGIPIKITKYGSHYPFIDINTYFKKKDNIIVPENQLVNGHIKKFNEKYKDIFPLKEAKFGLFKIKIPTNYNKILKNQYGKDVLKICKITYNHKPYCKNKDCENENASEHQYKQIRIKDISDKYIVPKIYD